MSSNRNDWCTPPEVLERVQQVGSLDLDPCWNPRAITHKYVKDPAVEGHSSRVFIESDNALKLDWRLYMRPRGVCYVNPPYSDEWTAIFDGKPIYKGTSKKGVIEVATSIACGKTYTIEKTNSIGWWIDKCQGTSIGDKARPDRSVIALVPARTDTKWAHFVYDTAQAICYWRGRLKFLGAPSSAPFPSAVVYWGPRAGDFYEAFKGAGKVIDPLQIPRNL